MNKRTSQALTKRKGSAEFAIQMVLDGLTSQHSKRAYERQLREFIRWFAKTGQGSMSKAVVQRYASDLRDGPHHFMAGHQRENGPAPFIADLMDVGVADAAI